MKVGGKNGTLRNELLTNDSFYLASYVAFVMHPFYFGVSVLWLKGIIINGFWNYFSYGVNVE